MSFSHYIALGDAVSMDLYPALDAGETEVAVALERLASAGTVAPLGAASLLYENDSQRWPEFEGRDLVSVSPGIRYTNLAQDGATVGDVFGEQLPALEPSEEPTLITVTLGVNDLMSAFASEQRRRVLERAVQDIAGAYAVLVERIAELFPERLLVLATVYDPTDRGGRLPGVIETSGRLPLQHLDALNGRIRDLARDTPGAALAEVYGHFLGHGMSVAPGDRWYWRRSPVEPSAMGASEVRRVWADVIERAEAAD